MKKLIVFICLAVLLVGGLLFARPFLFDTTVVEEISVEELEALGDQNFVPTFTQVPLDFEHEYVDGTLPFLGSAVVSVAYIDMHSGFSLGGGRGQADVLYHYENGEFEKQELDYGSDSATYGIAVVDIDNNFEPDLILAKEDGLYMGYMRHIEKADIEFPENTVPFSVAPADINRDGHMDLYVSTWIEPSKFKSATFNDEAHKTPNLMLLNNGDTTFTDVTDEVGLTYSQNTFISSFVDLNDDGFLDLVVAPNTDMVRIFANDGDGTFTEQVSPTAYGFWMGLTAVDYDNDGDQDLALTNIGTTVPVSVGRGDLRSDQEFTPEWALLRNDGDFNFTDVTDEVGMSGFEFAWGINAADLNLNGRDDFVVSTNYIKWPAHKLSKGPGRVLMNGEDGTYLSVTEVSGAENRNYGINPLLGDFNGDGYIDIVYANVDGPSLAYLNDGSPNEVGNHYLKVMPLDDARAVGAKVRVELSDGEVLEKRFHSSMGLLSDSDSALTFGLGQGRLIEKVTVEWLDGEVETFDDVELDTVLFLE